MAVKVAINGYGTIGKRVADAVSLQKDMEVAGVVKTRPSFEARIANEKGLPLFANSRENENTSAKRAMSFSCFTPKTWYRDDRTKAPATSPVMKGYITICRLQ